MSIWFQRLVILVAGLGTVPFVLIGIKSPHHEFLHLPGILVCRRGDAMDYEVTPNGGIGRMETFDLVNCTFYWWENNRGGD